MHWPLYMQGKKLHTWCKFFGEEKNPLPLLEIEPQFLGCPT